MRFRLKTSVFLIGVVFFYVSCAGNTTEEINRLFNPLMIKYGIKIFYDIDDRFPPILTGGQKAKIEKAEPVEKHVLIHYPMLIEKAFAKYPVSVIQKNLSGLYFAKSLHCGGLQYAGTYDLYRRIVYVMNDGNKPDDFFVATFHHEFSSILLKRHGFFLNPWLEQNPAGFTYLIDASQNPSLDLYSGSLEGTAEDYEEGFLNAYSRTSFEEDFNEYSSMIFTHPQRYRKLMNRYPRIRRKFLVWLDFYHGIDPIFTEDYLFGFEENVASTRQGGQ